MAAPSRNTADRVGTGFAWLLGLLVFSAMLWLIWRPVAPAPEPPALKAYHARQQEACKVVKAARDQLLAKGLEQQAKRLDVDSVCDASRPMRHGLYWLIGICAVPIGLILLSAAASPRF